MKELNKINWTVINPDDESTFPPVTQNHVMFAYRYNDYHEEYLIKFWPNFYLVTEFTSSGITKKVYLKRSINTAEDVEIKRWAILELEGEDK